MQRKIRFGIPSKGRLKEPSLALLDQAGINVIENSRSYIWATTNPNFEVVLARAFDVPIYVQYGAIDLGITGQDIILERDAQVQQLLTLDFGQCSLVVAVPEASQISRVEDIDGVARIATEYPNLSNKYFEALGKQVEILEVRGSTELAPQLGLGEIIVDITSTGTTLRKNQLRIISKILGSTCVLVCNKLAYRLFESEIQKLLKRIRENGGTGN
ncbi:MAG: ATP phosphoribosyltransferase [Candidatus Heimdallarchaeota archaeon]|nr:ATP phosphoribosyltransferase [Candidatus Heimdallarchaeota archaeon]